MQEEKFVSKSPIFDYFKKQTNGINVTNEIKEEMIDYLNEKINEEIDRIIKFTLEIMELQNKRTIQEKDWEFIKNHIK
ncbi:MAG: hypothetical protein JXA54_03530 [Candidatus Heimdallarchaeota archaeon]|nr:hypothetical protein [Candidatus Heimdallarchaeota archaeon]